MKHVPLNTWDTFINFVNRSIYGGTINISSEQSGTMQTEEPPELVQEIGGTFMRYAGLWHNNNLDGFIPMMQIIFSELLLIPLILFAPGVYYLASKSRKYAVFIFGLFIFYTSVQLIFIAVSPKLHPFTLFSNRPFYISSIFVLTIISAAGLQFLFEQLHNKILSGIAAAAIISLPLMALVPNFGHNNESKNYIAHDFNKNLMASVPQDGYFISTGKDNLTFPLYYLKKIENFRPDVSLEIYYGRSCLQKNDLDERLATSGKKVLFIDLLPCGYKALDLKPYNFLYAYGDTTGLPPSEDINSYTIRGLRQDLDYPNGRLEGLYFLKLAYGQPQNPEKQFEIFDKIQNELPQLIQFKSFILEYIQNKDDTGMF
jgi:hypothetical protein